MEVKKTERADLEKNKSVYTLLGLAITLSIVWFSFEYKTYDRALTTIQSGAMIDDEEDVVLQTQRQEPPPPPPPPQQTTVIEIVEDDIEVEDLDIDIETDDNEDIEAQIVVSDDEGEDKEDEIFVFVEDNPEYPGGDIARITYLRDNTKYPEMAKESGIQGTVYMSFVVEKDGHITDVKVVRGIGGGCDEEAIRVIRNMPNWKPGKQRGRSVRVQFSMPIKFTLAG